MLGFFLESPQKMSRCRVADWERLGLCGLEITEGMAVNLTVVERGGRQVPV